MSASFPFDHPEIVAVLQRLHDAAARDKRRLIPRLPRYAWARLTGRLNEPAFRHDVFADVFSAVTPERGAVLYLLARAIRARRVVEFGSSMGISTIYLAAALRDNFPGETAPAVKVTGSEMEPAKVQQALDNVQAAGLANLVRIQPGDALQTLQPVEAPIDMVFLDGRKDLYLGVLRLLEPKLRRGAVIVADNIDSFRGEVGHFLAYVKAPQNGFASATIGMADGMEISVFERGS